MIETKELGAGSYPEPNEQEEKTFVFKCDCSCKVNISIVAKTVEEAMIYLKEKNWDGIDDELYEIENIIDYRIEEE